MTGSRLAIFALAAGTITLLACGGGSTPAAPKEASPAAKPATQATTAPAAAAGSPAAKPAAASPAAALKSSGPALSSPTKIAFATTSVALTYAPFWVALGKDYFKDENLELELVLTGSGAKSLTTIATGSAPLGFFDASNAVKPISLGQPIFSPGVLYAEPYFVGAVKSEVIQRTGVQPTAPIEQRAGALKGLKIGITSPGSGSDRMVRNLLQMANLDPERDAEIVATGSSANMLAAFARGSLDAMFTVSPFIDEAIVRHNAVKFVSLPEGDMPALQGTPGFAFFAHRPSIESNPALAVALMKGVLRAVDLIQTNPEEAKKAYLEGISQASDKLPEPEILDSGWALNTRGFPKDPAWRPDQAQKVIAYAEDVEGEDFKTTPEQLFDNQYLEQARRALVR